LALRAIRALNLEKHPDFALIKENVEGKSKTEIDDQMAALQV
jgi:hypothetical protein